MMKIPNGLQEMTVKTMFTGLDYLTLSLTEQNYKECRDCIDYLTKVMKSLGYVTRPLRTQYVNGEQIGLLKIGSLRSDKQKTIVTISRHYSNVLALWTPKQLRVTRVDVCCDFFLSKKDLELRRFFSEESDRLDRKYGERSTVKYIKSRMGGFTFYFGSGGNGKLLRIYDKGAQMDGRPGVWIRYELQVGRTYATSVREGYFEAMNNYAYSHTLLHNHCDKIGVYFPTLERYLVDGVATTQVTLGNDEKERSKKYMRSTVQPFLRKFRRLHGDEFTISELGVEGIFK